MRRFTKGLAIVTAMAMAMSGVAVNQSDAKAKLALNKKSVKITVGKTKVVKVKGAKKSAKVTWKVGSKKIVKLVKTTKKGNATAKIKGLKKGSTTVKAIVKQGSSKKTLKVKVSVLAKASNNAPKATDAPKGPDAPTKATDAPKTSDAPQTSEAPTKGPDATSIPTTAPTEAAPTQGPKATWAPLDPSDLTVKDLTLDLSGVETTFTKASPISFEGLLPDYFDVKLFKAVEVKYSYEWEDGADTSALNCGKIAVVGDPDQLDGSQDTGSNLTYGATSLSGVATINISLEDGLAGINVQPMDSTNGYAWPAGLMSVTISGIKLIAEEDCEYPDPNATAVPVGTPTVVPSPTVKPTFAPQTKSYTFDDEYTLGYNGKILQFNKGATAGTAVDKDKIYNLKEDNVFASHLANNNWFDDDIKLTQPLRYTEADGKINEVDSLVTDYNLWADPTAIDNTDNDGKLYVYGTTEGIDYSKGKLAENAYNNHSLTIASTADMINWTDEGFLDNLNLTNEVSTSTTKVANKWGTKAWAPSGLKIDGDGDGEDEYYIFYTNSGAVGYVQGDSPTGPWKDDLKQTLFTQKSPNCEGVVWCFDPAVLADDKGNAYVYFGGGIPDGQDEFPNTARVCKIKFEKGTGKVLLDGDPQVLNNYYMFEDSEINQFNGKYYYSYCANFQVPGSAKALLSPGSIATYVSSDPMNISFDPTTEKGTKFTDEKGVYHNYLGMILNNPSTLYGEFYNNHHHMQSFKGHDYIFYHSTVLGNNLYRMNKKYRNLHVDPITIDKDTDKITINPSFKGAEQIEDFEPYKTIKGEQKFINATTHAKSAGINSKRDDIQVEFGINGSPMVVDNINTGDWTMIKGVDFGEKGLKKFGMEYASRSDAGRVEVFIDAPTDINNKIASIQFLESTKGAYKFEQVDVTKEVKGKHDVYFVFRGEGYNVASWMFSEGTEITIPDVSGRPTEVEEVDPNEPSVTDGAWNADKTEFTLALNNTNVTADGGAKVEFADPASGSAVTVFFDPKYPGAFFKCPLEDQKFSSVEFTFENAITGAGCGKAVRYDGATSDTDVKYSGLMLDGETTCTIDLTNTKVFDSVKIFNNESSNNADYDPETDPRYQITIKKVVFKK